ncbi:MarR family winged helix-turn-helix transcriptional regulator [Novosphingobium mangrovi (ex Huang et al. 2023)]|uniref:MarR family transcriptional regulator n=1 Tax=Novosphingobium mangrovi (ex Huang et al. 2023) TaxID=2976432 RepID=A0ABT2I7K6_9SPHN|nr:MarR family transcriptional regulator [Novosphingobium mangrovi (ex Huang et al. 2023)]MCT2400815.1 MarR family transcriptional regulator [Novosphingobium mangrovi (ex Huang et al. 2023)]
MERRVGTVLAQVARLMRRAFDERAREIGVTRPQWQVLSVLLRHEGIKQGGLAEILEVEPITAGRMIDRMQDAGLVERRDDPADRRAWRLYLTGRGREIMDRLQPLARETSDQTLSGISEAETAALLGTLEKMLENLTGRPAGANSWDD